MLQNGCIKVDDQSRLSTEHQPFFLLFLLVQWSLWPPCYVKIIPQLERIFRLRKLHKMKSPTNTNPCSCVFIGGFVGLRLTARQVFVVKRMGLLGMGLATKSHSCVALLFTGFPIRKHCK